MTRLALPLLLCVALAGCGQNRPADDLGEGLDADFRTIQLDGRKMAEGARVGFDDGTRCVVWWRGRVEDGGLAAECDFPPEWSHTAVWRDEHAPPTEEGR